MSLWCIILIFFENCHIVVLVPCISCHAHVGVKVVLHALGACIPPYMGADGGRGPHNPMHGRGPPHVKGGIYKHPIHGIFSSLRIAACPWQPCTDMHQGHGMPMCTLPRPCQPSVDSQLRSCWWQWMYLCPFMLFNIYNLYVR